ncbi:MAG: 2OG-Fe(II) oxygenase [Pseudomonadota bacterium]
MNNSVTLQASASNSQLQRARALPMPSRDAMLQRDLSVQQFWDTHRGLLRDAWREWEEQSQSDLPEINETCLDQHLREAVADAWLDPSKEAAVRALWHEEVPGVYSCQFFDPEKIASLRNYFDSAADAGIPLRPPYGIALNRGGAMLDVRSEGYLAAPGFQAFYQQLLDTYMRPIARLLFPEVFGYDTQTFGFSIHYQADTDASLRPHTDASAATLNINMNLPDEAFTGSEVDFINTDSGQVKRTVFKPGVAMIHRGSVPHAAQPITSGSRANLVLWLYGDRMQIPRFTDEERLVDAKHRWTVPTEISDDFAPF